MAGTHGAARMQRTRARPQVLDRFLQRPAFMNAIDLLKQQHDLVDDLFDQVEQADATEKEILFEELADNLAGHAAIEEHVFYPAAYAGETREILNEAVEEHLVMKRLITDLMDLTPEDQQFTAKLKVLREQVTHHVKEEEKELFPKAKKELGKEKLLQLGAEMQGLFTKEMAEGAAYKVPDQTAQAAQISPDSAPLSQ
jgi:iron-sulfur cluster repair protein YtfE (RIC family)